MTVLYRNAALSNLGSRGPLKCMVDKLNELVGSPQLLWDKTFCCFEVPNGSIRTELSQAVHESLCRSPADEVSLGLVSRAASAFLRIVERQAERYLPGGESADLEQDLVMSVENAPADNMFAEFFRFN